MSDRPVEFAGSSTLMDRRMTRDDVLKRAPAWWRDLALRGAGRKQMPGISNPAPSAAATRAVIGWVWGLAGAGISEPCLSHDDPHELPEQFHQSALEQMARQCNAKSHTIDLRWGHDGEELVSNRSGLDLLLRVVDLFGQPGLALEARLHHSPAAKRALELMQAGQIGVSVGYARSCFYHADRPGVGRVRVVTSCQLHHIALIGQASGKRAVFPACTARASAGSSLGCSRQLRDEVQHHAWRVLTQQAQQLR